MTRNNTKTNAPFGGEYANQFEKIEQIKNISYNLDGEDDPIETIDKLLKRLSNMRNELEVEHFLEFGAGGSDPS